MRTLGETIHFSTYFIYNTNFAKHHHLKKKKKFLKTEILTSAATAVKEIKNRQKKAEAIS